MDYNLSYKENETFMFMDKEAQVSAVKQFLMEQFVMLHFAQTQGSMAGQFISMKCLWISAVTASLLPHWAVKPNLDPAIKTLNFSKILIRVLSKA